MSTKSCPKPRTFDKANQLSFGQDLMDMQHFYVLDTIPIRYYVLWNFSRLLIYLLVSNFLVISVFSNPISYIYRIFFKLD